MQIFRVVVGVSVLTQLTLGRKFIVSLLPVVLSERVCEVSRNLNKKSKFHLM